jgi:hypothetical protein
MDRLSDLLAAPEGPPVIPCRTNPEMWFSLEPADVVAAIEACGHCPLRDPCDSFARAMRPRGGVWAGVIWNDNGRPGVNSTRARKIAAYAQARRDAA